jgi:hypothetical protein
MPTRFPKYAAWVAAFSPAGPEPITRPGWRLLARRAGADYDEVEAFINLSPSCWCCHAERRPTLHTRGVRPRGGDKATRVERAADVEA